MRERETVLKSMGERGLERSDGVFVCWLVAQRPSNMRVYLREGSAQTILCAATLR